MGCPILCESGRTRYRLCQDPGRPCRTHRDRLGTRKDGTLVVSRSMAPVLALLLMVMSTGVTAAQAGPVPPGTSVPYVDVTGAEHGTVTVTQLLNPFTDFPEDKAPEAGSRLVVVTLSVEGTGEDGIEVYTPSIWLQDASGALWGESFPCCFMDDFPEPELTITTVGPGSRISGWIGYTVPADAQVQAVIYQPESGIILIPADMGSARPAVGTPVTVVGADDSQATVTVAKVEDPYKGFAKDDKPPKGTRYVMVTASFENTGENAFDLQVNGALLRDARGALWAPTEIRPRKKPKLGALDSIDLGRGNLVSGRLGYQVPADVELEGLYYQGGGHLTRIAALGEAGATPTPAAEATCDEMTPWWAQVNPILVRLTKLPPFQADAAPMDLAASRAMLSDVQAIVADFRAVTSPDTLVAQHRRVLGALLLYERSAQDQVAAQEGSDVGLLAASEEEFQTAQLVMSDALAALDALGIDDCEGG